MESKENIHKLEVKSASKPKLVNDIKQPEPSTSTNADEFLRVESVHFER